MWPSALAFSLNSKNVRSNPDDDMIWIPGGTFIMGSERHYMDEQPVHRASVEGFWIDKHAVTNEQFSNFVEATNYVTVAERPPNIEEYPDARPEMLQPASVVFVKPAQRVDLRNHYNWWAYVAMAISCLSSLLAIGSRHGTRSFSVREIPSPSFRSTACRAPPSFATSGVIRNWSACL